MINMKVRLKLKLNEIKKIERKSRQGPLKHIAAKIRLTAKRSIRPAPKKKKVFPKPGRPPRTRTKILPRSIVFSVDSEGAVIGPKRDEIAHVANLLEFGGKRRGQRFRRFPFMGPAFEKILPEVPRAWANSIVR
jgi:hypothetical protein